MKLAKFAACLLLLLAVTAAPAQADEGRTTYISGGEALTAAAARFHCDAELLAAMNGLPADAQLMPGQRLYLPEEPPQPTQPAEELPLLITVQRGDTLFKLAQTHGTTVEALAALNGISNIDLIRVGQKLLLPSAGGAEAELPGADNAAYAMWAAGGSAAQPASELLLLSWPLKGYISSDFGWRSRGYHHGLDIAAAKGTAIGAVAAGEVVFSGWHSAAYGYAVKLRHADGVETLYAHASRLCVRKGEQVSQNQKIAEVGKSGNATGYHLHLELRFNGEATDPLPFLPE